MFRPYDPTETALGSGLKTLYIDVYDPTRLVVAVGSCRVGQCSAALKGAQTCHQSKKDGTILKHCKNLYPVKKDGTILKQS